MTYLEILKAMRKDGAITCTFTVNNDGADLDDLIQAEEEADSTIVQDWVLDGISGALVATKLDDNGFRMSNVKLLASY